MSLEETTLYRLDETADSQGIAPLDLQITVAFAPERDRNANL